VSLFVGLIYLGSDRRDFFHRDVLDRLAGKQVKGEDMVWTDRIPAWGRWVFA
jgi:hypothetical protein